MKNSKTVKLSDVVGLVVSCSFIFTVVYIFGLSKSLKLNIFKYFSPNDYLKLSIEWITPVAIFFALGIVANYFLTRIERGTSEEELAASSPFPRFTRYFRKSADLAIPLFAIIPAIILLIISFFADVPNILLYGIWQYAAVILWGVFIFWYIRVPKLVAGWTNKMKFFIVAFPAVIIFSLLHGMYKGEVILQDMNAKPKVKLIIVNQSAPILGQVVLLLDKYVLFADHDRKIIKIFPTIQIWFLEELTLKIEKNGVRQS